MHKNTLLNAFLLCCSFSFAQAPQLTVEQIMKDPKWIGTSPSSPQWSLDSKTLYFEWNPDNADADSLYQITLTDRKPAKSSLTEKKARISPSSIQYNQLRTAYCYAKEGDIYFVDKKTTKRVTQTIDIESNPIFSFNETAIAFQRNQNLYAWMIATGETKQLTNTRTSGETNAAPGSKGNKDEEWLKKDQLQWFDVLRERKEKTDKRNAYQKAIKEKDMRSIAIGNKILAGLDISPDGRFVPYRLMESPTSAKATIIPDYVTESGFTTDIPGRTKVGSAQTAMKFYIYDRVIDSIITLSFDSLPGIYDIPAYVNDYPSQLAERKKKNEKRSVTSFNPKWSPDGKWLVYDIRSDDNKDRWLMAWNTTTFKWQLIDRQHDDAWIGGPIFGNGWIDAQQYWFLSEATGFSHIYIKNITTGETRALTSGEYEVQSALLSVDKKSFYITTNEVHPGEKQYYRLDIATGKQQRLTNATGANQVSVSPDEKWLAILYSSSTQPWELYVQENKAGAKPQQITSLAKSGTFNSYQCIDPEVTSFKARDGEMVYARVYKPAQAKAGSPAVLFVHGAGYLQNAHKWWSSYFREYMFNNLLAQQGYYVMDIDYRGSAGYGRDWRTGIYRYMGGKDLTDHLDAVRWMVKEYGIDSSKVGLYGGSYGGFITLMALFTQPGFFKAGAALRPVTDWANYNHGYTSNILNEPYTDSIAYRRSSPLYFANGLQDHLLICHGMVDINVHYQDAVKLTQRLIELGKDNWELASYPMEDHAFVEPSSWTDEYKRILKLFNEVLKGR